MYARCLFPFLLLIVIAGRNMILSDNRVYPTSSGLNRPTKDTHVRPEKTRIKRKNIDFKESSEGKWEEVESHQKLEKKCVNLLFLTCLFVHSQSIHDDLLSVTVPSVLVSRPGPACEKYTDWVETACSGDGVCGPANSKCYLGKCLCDVGFFYSVGRRACVSSCAPADVQTDSYLTYPGGGIDGNNKYSKTGTDDECKQICSQDASCLSTEVHTDKTCYFHYVVATQSNWEQASGWTFHQKNCA